MSQESLIRRKQAAIAVLALVAIAVHLVLRFGTSVSATVQNLPLWVALALGGVPLVWELLVKLWRREFGSDLLGRHFDRDLGAAWTNIWPARWSC